MNFKDKFLEVLNTRRGQYSMFNAIYPYPLLFKMDGKQHLYLSLNLYPPGPLGIRHIHLMACRLRVLGATEIMYAVDRSRNGKNCITTVYWNSENYKNIDCNVIPYDDIKYAFTKLEEDEFWGKNTKSEFSSVEDIFLSNPSRYLNTKIACNERAFSHIRLSTSDLPVKYKTEAAKLMESYKGPLDEVKHSLASLLSTIDRLNCSDKSKESIISSYFMRVRGDENPWISIKRVIEQYEKNDLAYYDDFHVNFFKEYFDNAVFIFNAPFMFHALNEKSRVLDFANTTGRFVF